MRVRLPDALEGAIWDFQGQSHVGDLESFTRRLVGQGCDFDMLTIVVVVSFLLCSSI